MGEHARPGARVRSPAATYRYRRRIESTVRLLIDRFGMAPLPVEGTFFAQTYRSDERLGDGPVGTGGVGLFSVEPPSRSLFHRLTFDEVWHFYAGDPLRLVLLQPDGTDDEVILGDPLGGHAVQHVVPAGNWQAGEVTPGGAWSFFGVTMAPGFTADCFEGGRAADLLERYPSRAVDIERLSVPEGVPADMPPGFQS
jgi:predicted cupin superfamily sugar epimerase